eukprot:TRINITY_DN4269_c0_g1_i1.p2 TRINITY_DN4269_c0_g1~~TRINITY_DN4269_c0_g1_i1.p2  ORF type:complete len:138 (-),score=3.10 TRINITY_DN4269_c0_g1_i1:109-522(-)
MARPEAGALGGTAAEALGGSAVEELLEGGTGAEMLGGAEELLEEAGDDAERNRRGSVVSTAGALSGGLSGVAVAFGQRVAWRACPMARGTAWPHCSHTNTCRTSSPSTWVFALAGVGNAVCAGVRAGTCVGTSVCSR